MRFREVFALLYQAARVRRSLVRRFRHVAHNLTNLHVTLLDKMGVPAEKLGDSTGQFTELSGLSSV